MIRPYVRIAAADLLRFNDQTRVTDPAAYIGWHRERLAAAGDVARAWRCDLPVDGYISWGWWRANCPNCHAPMITHPVWRLGGCGDCGCLFGKIRIPLDYLTIESVLLLRPVRANHTWLAHETVDDLRRENVAHGVSDGMDNSSHMESGRAGHSLDDEHAHS